jgi:hypothetical protein
LTWSESILSGPDFQAKSGTRTLLKVAGGIELEYLEAEPVRRFFAGGCRKVSLESFME